MSKLEPGAAHRIAILVNTIILSESLQKLVEEKDQLVWVCHANEAATSLFDDFGITIVGYGKVIEEVERQRRLEAMLVRSADVA